MRSAAFCKVLGLGAVLALLWAPAPASAQAFFGLDETLRADSGIELTYGHTTDHSGDGINPADDTASDVETRRANARVAYRALIAGALGSSLRNHQVTSTVDQTEVTHRSAAYGALAFDGVFTKDNDRLFLEVNSNRTHEEFAYNGYQRRLDSLVSHEWGIAYRLGFLMLGYARGEERLQLRIDDPSGPTFTQELFGFPYRARLAGLFFGDPGRVSLGLVAARKDSPAVSGTTIDKEAGFEELKRVELRLFRLALSARQTRVLSAFTGDASSDVIERTTGLSLNVTPVFTFGLSQTVTTSQRQAIVLGTPATTRTRHTTDEVQFKLSF